MPGAPFIPSNSGFIGFPWQFPKRLPHEGAFQCDARFLKPEGARFVVVHDQVSVSHLARNLQVENAIIQPSIVNHDRLFARSPRCADGYTSNLIVDNLVVA